MIITQKIYENIKISLKIAEDSHYRLVLLVGKIDSGKTKVISVIAKDLQIPLVNLNLALSKELLVLTSRQRTLQLSSILTQITDQAPAPLLLDNTEILFDKKLMLDPLRLLQSVSRNRVVLASWSGSFIGQKLVYAESGHPEFRSYDSVDALIVSMDGEATVDSAK